MQQHMEDGREPLNLKVGGRKGQGDAAAKHQCVTNKYKDCREIFGLNPSPSALLPVWKHPAQG